MILGNLRDGYLFAYFFMRSKTEYHGFTRGYDGHTAEIQYFLCYGHTEKPIASHLRRKFPWLAKVY